jgi:hypothetical protein
VCGLVFWKVTKKVKSISLEIPQRKLEVVKLLYLLRDNTGVAGVVPKKYIMFRKTTLMLKNTSIRSDVEKHRS